MVTVSVYSTLVVVVVVVLVVVVVVVVAGGRIDWRFVKSAQTNL